MISTKNNEVRLLIHVSQQTVHHDRRSQTVESCIFVWHLFCLCNMFKNYSSIHFHLTCHSMQLNEVQSEHCLETKDVNVTSIQRTRQRNVHSTIPV